MFLDFEEVAATGTEKTVSNLMIPGNASHAELQSGTQAVRYTMDNATTPTQTVGMVMAVADPPKAFLVEDLLRIKFVRGAGSDGILRLHYFGGRDV